MLYKLQLLIFLLLCVYNVNGQVTTGIINFTSNYSGTIDINAINVTVTLVGQQDLWLGVGFGVSSMTNGGDVITHDSTGFNDRQFLGVGIAPTLDTQDWTVVSNTIALGIRTLVVSRPIMGSDSSDFLFNEAATNISLVWAHGNNTDVFGYHGLNNKGVLVAPLMKCGGVVKTWNGLNWSPSGVPGITNPVIISGSYSTTANGSIDACELSINTSVSLTIGANDYVNVGNDIIVDGTLTVEHAGNLVQMSNTSSITNNGTINVMLTTPLLTARDFMILGSPMTSEDEGAFVDMNGTGVGAYQVLNHTTINFTPYVGTPPVVGVNFHDQESNDWTNFIGTLSTGEGYLVRPSYTASGTYDYQFDQGTLNNGVITYSAFFGDDKEDSPNVISNPYASAIDADLLISSNAIVDELYFWEHNTTPSTGIPGPLSQNFSMEDISTRNLGMGIPSTTGGSTPNGVISTGQGFGIKANAMGDVIFSNALRLTSGNTTLRQSLEKDLIWIEVRESTYGMGSTTGIAFTEEATENLDAGYDTMKLGTVVSLYSHLENGNEQLGIQGREAFDTSIAIPMGFSTLIDADAGIPYVIDVSAVEGANIEQATVYLIDHFTNTMTNLSTDRYEFLSDAGTFDNRFTLQFEETLGISDSSVESVLVYPNPVQNKLTIMSLKETVSAVILYDVQGRKIKDVIFNNNIQLDLSRVDEGVYFVNVITEKGTYIKRIVKI